jgi:hypothetical protein
MKGPLRLLAILVVIALVTMALLSSSDVFERSAAVEIEDVGRFEFNPDAVTSVRSDVFVKSHFSVFDILVHLNRTGKIVMEYHYDESLATHVIDSIDGKPHWWYRAHYDGGWTEANNFRMDLFPYKDKMFIDVYRSGPARIRSLHESWAEEVSRLEANNGTIVIPTVIIRGPGLLHVFDDVMVTPHNLRNDTFKPGTVTAIDVILSLGDRDLISYDLKWYEEIGRAEVRNFFIDGIDGLKSYGTCGFVYEEGDKSQQSGNHIHIPSDYRVITSPEYEEWFWICL